MLVLLVLVVLFRVILVKVMGAIESRQLPLMSVQVAEPWAIWVVLCFSIDIGFIRLVVEFDCLQC